MPVFPRNGLILHPIPKMAAPSIFSSRAALFAKLASMARDASRSIADRKAAKFQFVAFAFA